MSDIQQFYNGKSIFITGATGFIGKVLLEKLLFSCKGVNKIYILIRKNNPKDGIGASAMKTRFEELLDNEVFFRLRSEGRNDLEKVIPIWGDITKPGLGISEEDEIPLINRVNIVFHIAATIKFNEPLKIMIKSNLFGTKCVLDFFKKLKDPVALIHISTAYANCHRPVIEEVVYPSPIDPGFILNASEFLNEEIMEGLTKHLLQGRPNTYVISKAIAESYLEQHGANLPIAIVRPSIVTNSKEEPRPGWNDSTNALIMSTYLIGTGRLRNFPTEWKAKMDIVPVDFLTNLLIASAWFTALLKGTCTTDKIPVYNMVSGTSNPLTYGEYFDFCFKFVRSNSIAGVISYPYLICRRSFVLLHFGIIFNHYLPSLFLDILRIFEGKKSKYFKGYRKYYTSAMPTLRFFSENDFNFKSERVYKLFHQMTEVDKKMFNFDVSSYQWNPYLRNMFRELFTHTSEENLVIPKTRMRKLYIRFVAFNICLLLSVFYTVLFTVGYLL